MGNPIDMKKTALSVGALLGGAGFTGDFEREMKVGSGNGASLSLSLSRGALRGEPGVRAPLQVILKDI